MTRILLVDDSSFMRTWLKKILHKHQYTDIYEAKNGFHAILQFRLHHPDLVLLDINMPEMDGIEVLKRLIKIQPNAAIIICSAMSPSYLIKECIELGAKDFVQKPHFDQVISKIVMATSNH